MGLDKKGADGIRLRSDGKPLEILLEYATVSFAGTTDMHQFTAEYLKKVGIKVILKSEERTLYETRAAENEYQITCWVRDRSAVPISDPNAFLSGGATGGTWNTWFDTGGKSGEKPPDDAPIVKARDLWNKVLVEPDEKKRQALWQQLLDFNKENLWAIGVCGEAPSIFVTKNNMRNVPSALVQDDPLRAYRLGMNQTWFFKK
jgi:peptide/nickel transport system substrate-binding protein